ncbi:MAG: toxin-antitoxin system YwqK family antitoxin [Planctomycetota bacterium]
MTTPRMSMALIIGFCLPWGCASPSSRDTTVPADATVRERTPIAAGPDTGGQATSGTRGDRPEPTVCDNKPMERLEEHWPNGNPKFFQEVVIDDEGNEIPHGLHTQFWPNGQKKLEMEYDCGVRHGPRLTWYESGKLWSQGEFVNGKDHGHWVVWYSDEKKSQEFTMVNGVWHGVQAFWDSNGQKRMEVEWVDGKRQGPLRLWGEDGDLKSADHYVDDIKQPTPLHSKASASGG